MNWLLEGSKMTEETVMLVRKEFRPLVTEKEAVAGVMAVGVTERVRLVPRREA